jgi:hypothetical protein
LAIAVSLKKGADEPKDKKDEGDFAELAPGPTGTFQKQYFSLLSCITLDQIFGARPEGHALQSFSP